MLILALTGGIASGKSTASAMLQRFGVRVLDADRVVHTLLGPGGACVEAVASTFPGAREGGQINRKKLGAAVFGNRAALEKLEAILHPAVRDEIYAFLKRERRKGTKMVALEIVLLFESAHTYPHHASVLVSAPTFLRWQRARRRTGMTRAAFDAIVERQMPEHEKRRHAGVVVTSGMGKAHTQRQLRRLLNQMRQTHA